MCQNQNFSSSLNTQQIDQFINRPYKYGFTTVIDSEILPKGLNENLIKLISSKKKEPAFMLKFRLTAYKKWQQMRNPSWAYINYPSINYENIIYYSVPKVKKNLTN